MSHLHRGLLFVVLCSWGYLCNGIHVCTNNTSVSPCCPCPKSRLCNTTCPKGFEEIRGTGQECIVETTHIDQNKTDTDMAANDTKANVTDNQADLNDTITTSTTIPTHAVHCRKCPAGFYVDSDFTTHCKSCPAGFYLDNNNTTHCCHPACRTCTGQGAATCTSCMVEFENTCVTRCPNGHEEVEASEVYTKTTTGAYEQTKTTTSSSISNDSPSKEVVEGSTSSVLINIFDNNKTYNIKVCHRYSQNPNTLIIGLSVGGGVLFIILIIVIIVLVRKCNIGKRLHDHEVEFGRNRLSENYEDVDLTRIPSRPIVTNDNNIVDSDALPSTTIRHEIQANDEGYEDVIVSTERTGNSKPIQKVLVDYDDVIVNNIKSSKTTESARSGHPGRTETVTNVNVIDTDKNPTDGTGSSKPTTKVLADYDDVIVENIPSSKPAEANSPGSLEACEKLADGVEQQSEELYDDVLVGAPKEGSNADSDSG